MKSFRLILRRGALASFFLLVLAPIAGAQATRTWVSGLGDDANPCSRTAPCKTFAGAISKTAANGEINCLDPGGFGAVTITKSITIDCSGVLSGVLVSGTNGIVITDSGANSIVVTLRNLDIDGLETGLSGISFLSGKSLRVEHSTIYGFTTAGISITAGTGARLAVYDVTITDCTTGISAAPSAGNSVSDVTSVRISNTTTAIATQGAAIMSVRDSSISNNTYGVVESGSAGGQVTLANNQFTGQGTAVQASAGSYICVFGNIFFSNGLVLNTNSGAIYTDGKNTMGGNGAVGAPNAVVSTV
jgi:Periplasmic copper-binding protein (NosD)